MGKNRKKHIKYVDNSIGYCKIVLWIRNIRLRIGLCYITLKSDLVFEKLLNFVGRLLTLLKYGLRSTILLEEHLVKQLFYVLPMVTTLLKENTANSEDGKDLGMFVKRLVKRIKENYSQKVTERISVMRAKEGFLGINHYGWLIDLEKKIFNGKVIWQQPQQNMRTLGEILGKMEFVKCVGREKLHNGQTKHILIRDLIEVTGKNYV